jgi:hypothetical protein
MLGNLLKYKVIVIEDIATWWVGRTKLMLEGEAGKKKRKQVAFLLLFIIWINSNNDSGLVNVMQGSGRSLAGLCP